MHFNLAIVTSIALIVAQCIGAPMEAPGKEPRGFLIATDPTAACSCPKNCDHEAGDSCKFYSGPSDTSPILEGRCVEKAFGLICTAPH